jgi:hypothetical protein
VLLEGSTQLPREIYSSLNKDNSFLGLTPRRYQNLESRSTQKLLKKTYPELIPEAELITIFDELGYSPWKKPDMLAMRRSIISE